MSGKQGMDSIPKRPAYARIKLTLHTQERFFGPGICELLEKIQQTGSIQAASKSLEDTKSGGKGNEQESDHPGERWKKRRKLNTDRRRASGSPRLPGDGSEIIRRS